MYRVPTKTVPRLDKHNCEGLRPRVLTCNKGAIQMRGFHFSSLRHEHSVLAHPGRCSGYGACVRALRTPGSFESISLRPNDDGEAI